MSFSPQSIGTLSPHKDHHTIGVSCFDYKCCGNKNGEEEKRSKRKSSKNTAKLSLLVTIALSGIWTWRDFDSLYLCLVLNALTLVLNVLAENLDALKCWWLGGIYSPNHQSGRWEGLLSYGTSDTIRCASHVTQLLGFDCWSSDMWGHRTVTVHCPVRHLAPALTLRAQSALFTFADDRWCC